MVSRSLVVVTPWSNPRAHHIIPRVTDSNQPQHSRTNGIATVAQNCNAGDIAKSLEVDLTSLYGPLLSGGRLSQALGYPSLTAFRQALSRGRVPVPVFSLPNQRGKHALVKDVANWLARQRANAEKDVAPKPTTAK